MYRTAHRVVLVVAALVLVPSQGLGWGRDGHQVIANLAQSRLSPQARTGVAALLHGATLASVSTDADNYRNNHPETGRWHFVNIPLGDGHYNPARDCAPSPQGDCIIAAIERFAAILADPSRLEDERAEALKFLVHFVADLHQPLHTTTNNDRGGNDTRVTFFGQPTNLHALWDSGLIEHTGLTVTAWTDLLKLTVRGWLKMGVERLSGGQRSQCGSRQNTLTGCLPATIWDKPTSTQTCPTSGGSYIAPASASQPVSTPSSRRPPLADSRTVAPQRGFAAVLRSRSSIVVLQGRR